MTDQDRSGERRVLVVDDDDSLRNLIIKTLQKYGIHSTGAATGAEALEYIGADPSVVMLLDQNLPDMTGRDVIGVLGSRCTNSPFVMMTGQGDERLAVEMMKLGAADYLIKDTNFIDLLPGAMERLFRNLETEARLRTAEAELSESREKLSSILNNSEDVIWSSTWPDMVPLFVSPSAGKVFGYPAGDFMKAPSLWKKIINKDDLPEVSKAMAELPVYGRYEIEIRMIKPDGSQRWQRYNMYLVYDAAGEPVRIDGTVRDITARKNAEQALQQQLQDKETLLKETHHRIKNNITSIAGLLSLQAGTVSSPEAVSALQSAITRVKSMSDLYDKMLMKNEYREVVVGDYLGGLVDSVVSIFSCDVPISVVKEFDSFTLDPKTLFPLGIIVNELLTNAMKYAFTGRDSGLFCISARVNDRHVSVCLSDNGRGFPEGFDIKKTDGFGLSLVQMFCQQLKGRFLTENHDGTRFIIEFDIP